MNKKKSCVSPSLTQYWTMTFRGWLKRSKIIRSGLDNVFKWPIYRSYGWIQMQTAASDLKIHLPQNSYLDVVSWCFGFKPYQSQLFSKRDLHGSRGKMTFFKVQSIIATMVGVTLHLNISCPPTHTCIPFLYIVKTMATCYGFYANSKTVLKILCCI